MDETWTETEMKKLFGNGNLPEGWREPWHACIEETSTGWSGHLQLSGGVGVSTGKTREEVIRGLGEVLYLTLEDIAESGEQLRPTQTHDPEEQAQDEAEGATYVWITPAWPNPISLAMRSAQKASQLSQQQLADRMKTTQSAVSRLANLFYWKQSSASLWRFYRAVGRYPQPTLASVE